MNDEALQTDQPETMAERIRTLRVGLEINQRELAKRARVSHSLISLLESGKRQTVSFDAGAGIAQALGVSLAWLRCEPGAKKERRDPNKSGILPVADLFKRNAPSDPEMGYREGDLEAYEQACDLQGAQTQMADRYELAAALAKAACGMRALQNPDARLAVLELFKLMIECPEKSDSLREAIHTMATAASSGVSKKA